jgi:iron complex outermembrane receptor protein
MAWKSDSRDASISDGVVAAATKCRIRSGIESVIYRLMPNQNAEKHQQRNEIRRLPMRRRTVPENRLLWMALVLGAPATLAAQSEDSYQVVVSDTREGDSDVRLDLDSGEPETSIGEAVADLPGVSAIRKGASSTQLVLRGLAGERVITRVGGVPLYGACPSVMDPPVTYLGADVLQRAAVELGAASVSNGVVGLGGAVEMSMDYRRTDRTQDLLESRASAFYDGARDGLGVAARSQGGTGPFDYRVTAGWIELGDYTTAAGDTVPAGLEQAHGSLSLAYEEGKQRLWSGFLFKHEADVDFVALPMDNRRTNFWLGNLGYRREFSGGALERIELTGGMSLVDHKMNNRDKPNRTRLKAVTPSITTSVAASASSDWRLAEEVRLNVGLDLHRLGRDATRTRLKRATGEELQDHIWPDASQWTGGAFAELRYRSESILARIGARGDWVATGANSVTDAMLTQYARYYGDRAGDIDRDEQLGAVQALAAWYFEEESRLALSAGVSSRAAGITERYFAFGPAPGGFQIGDPGLAPEKKMLADLGVELSRPWLQGRAHAFYSYVDDFILRTLLDQRDANGDGTIDSIYGFDNIAAQLFGFEVSADFKPFDFLSFPAAISWVRGTNETDGRDLPEIPPLEASVAARFEMPVEPVRLGAELGARFAARQEYVDPEYGEDETPGFAVLHARASIMAWDTVEVLVGVENLLDADYHEHLTREAIMAVGTLQPGDEVNAPGRSVFVMVRGEI